MSSGLTIIRDGKAIEIPKHVEAAAVPATVQAGQVSAPRGEDGTVFPGADVIRRWTADPEAVDAELDQAEQDRVASEAANRQEG